MKIKAIVYSKKEKEKIRYLVQRMYFVKETMTVVNLLNCIQNEMN